MLKSNKPESNQPTQPSLDRLETLKPSCSSDEMETTITFLRNSSKMTIYTNDNTMVTKLNKLLPGGQYKVLKVIQGKDGPTGYILEAPKNLLSFRKDKVVRELTDEQKRQVAERFKTLREKKQDQKQ